jgi:hypothetical protein
MPLLPYCYLGRSPDGRVKLFLNSFLALDKGKKSAPHPATLSRCKKILVIACAQKFWITDFVVRK